MHTRVAARRAHVVVSALSAVRHARAKVRARTTVVAVRRAIGNIAPGTAPARVTDARQCGAVARAMATAVQRLANGNVGQHTVDELNHRGRPRAAGLITLGALEPRRKVAQTRAALARALARARHVTANARAAGITHTAKKRAHEGAVHTRQLARNARVVGEALAELRGPVTDTVGVARRRARAGRNTAVNTKPLRATDTGLKASIAGTVAVAVTVSTRTGWLAAQRATPRVTRSKRVAHTLAVDNAAVATALQVAPRPTPARQTRADAAVHGSLHAVGAGQLAGWAHPARNAVLARRTTRRIGIAEATTVAVRYTRTLGHVATNVRPPRVTRARCRRGIAHTVVGAVSAVARTAGNFTSRPTEARRVIAHTDTANHLSVARAGNVAAKTGPTGVADTNARVHGELDTVRARVQAPGTHPALDAVLACWCGDGVVAGTARRAQRNTAAKRRLAARPHPTRIAHTRGQGCIALAVVRATRPRGHAQIVAHAARSGRRRAGHTRAVAGTPGVLAKLTPVAGHVIARTNARRNVVHTATRALHIAAHTVPTGIAHTVARVHRHLHTMRARVRAARTHPALDTVLAHRWEGRPVAVPTAAAVRAGASERLTARSSPPRRARARGRRCVARAMATAWAASQHAGHAVQIAVARAAGNIAQWAPATLEVVADAQVGRAVVRPMPRALQVAARAVPARIADAIAGVLGGFKPHDTRFVATRPHPWPAAVLADGRDEGRVAHTTHVAVRSGTRRDLASDAHPALQAETRRRCSNARSVACAVAPNTGAARHLTVGAPKARQGVAHARAADDGSVAAAHLVAPRASVARLTHANAVCDHSTKHARRVAVIAHPSSRAVVAHRRVGQPRARPTAVALRHTRTHGNGAVVASPVGANACVCESIARAVAVAVAVRAGAAGN